MYLFILLFKDNSLILHGSKIAFNSASIFILNDIILCLMLTMLVKEK